MKPIASPLNIIDFAIIKYEYSFVQPQKSTEDNLIKYFKEYDLEIDFSIHGDELIQVIITAKVNKGKKVKPGYSIYAEVACIFEFDDTIKITEENKKNIEGFSTIYIALNSLRGLVSQFTASGPIGRYLLPSIDLNDLIKKKKALNDEVIAPKRKVSKKSAENN